MKGLYPHEVVPFSLELHGSMPDAERPVFYARFLTLREETALEEWADREREALTDLTIGDVGQVDGAASVAERTVAYFAEILGKRLAAPGWKNVVDRDGHVIPFNADGLRTLVGDVCDAHLAQQLIVGAARAVRVGPETLGKLPSPSASPAASTAPGAPGSSEPTPPPEVPKAPATNGVPSGSAEGG